MKIFVATGNADKFNRMKNWVDTDFIWLNPNDLDTDLAKETKVTDEEEKAMGDMAGRAIGKAKKAAKALANYGEEMLILAMDDTGYFPFFDQYIVDLRTPPDIVQDGVLKVKAVENRLSGAGVSNHYAHIVSEVATQELMQQEAEKYGYTELPDFKFMPVVWKFALAAVENGKYEQAEVIANWEHVEYMKEEYLSADIKDTGYMLDKIIVRDLFGNNTKGLKEEIAPKIALQKLLESYR